MGWGPAILFRVSLVIIAITVGAPYASAQARVRVIVDQAVVWQPTFIAIATVVKAGTELEVVGRRDNWYEVVLPPTGATSGRTGMIAVNQVQVIQGRPPAPTPGGQRAQPRRPLLAPAQVRGFASIGYGRFDADQTFKAVLGRPDGVWFGGGGEYRFRMGIFIQGAVEGFRRTGERVFVTDAGDVFKLGVRDIVTIVPLTVTGGYRAMRRTISPYAGGGVGRYFFWETSPFADENDKVHEQFNSYHVMGGVEWRNGQKFSTAYEVQYTLVPDALKSTVSTVFNEHDVGGIQARVKLLFW